MENGKLLTYDDYQKLGGICQESDFDKLEKDAEDLINPITSFFYVHMDINSDMDQERVWLFKKALTLQIDFSKRMNGSTPDQMVQSDVKSVSVDGTSVSTGLSPMDYTTHGIYNIALDYLYQAGLLYRGVNHHD